MTSAIEVKNLTKIFHPASPWKQLFRSKKPIRALDQIDLVVSPGETVALMGPNGAGKTTLLKILATLILPDEGSARVFGACCSREEKKVKRQIGLLSNDDRGFYARLTGRQNLEFFAGLFGVAHISKKLGELSALLDLHFLEQRVQEYSAGMRQRLALARILLHDPALLLLDEPGRSLDKKTGGDFFTYLRENRKKTVVLATHNSEEAKKADRLVVLDKGRRIS